MGKKPDAMKGAGRAASSDLTTPADKMTDEIDVRADAGLGDDTDDVLEAGDTEVSTEEIRVDIEDTRAQMSETIDEIQERLSPRRLMQDAKETVRDATVGKVSDMMSDATESASGFVDRIKENPLPAAMLGLGAWWLFGRQSGTRSQRSMRYAPRTYAGRDDTAEFARTEAVEGDDYWRRSSGWENYGRSASGGGLVDTLKQHPVPAALAGLSMAWWLMERQRGNGDGAWRGSREYRAGFRQAERRFARLPRDGERCHRSRHRRGRADAGADR